MIKSILLCSFISFFHIENITSQTVLNADGSGNTYELINAVLAPGFDVIESPDCGHTTFNNGTTSNPSRHIDEIFDADLNTNVFRFHIHVTPDNDRCIATTTDRQRNEIKVYDKSPDNLKAVEGETFVYKWKFKLPLDFKPTTKFTHIHQLKSVNDEFDDMPMYTFTVYSSSGGVFVVRYAESSSQTTVKSVPLSNFLGNWVEVTETITYSNPGIYSLVINKVSDGTNILTYSNNNNNWRNVVPSGGSINDIYIRPKWGIYRSLDFPDDLRDEQVLFANFSIEENPTLSTSHNELNKSNIKIIPNPTNNQKLISINYTLNSVNSIYIYDNLGRLISSFKPQTNTVDITNFKAGIYFFILKKDGTIISTEKLIIQ